MLGSKYYASADSPEAPILTGSLKQHCEFPEICFHSQAVSPNHKNGTVVMKSKNRIIQRILEGRFTACVWFSSKVV